MLLYFPRQNQQMNPAMGMNAAQMMVAAQQNLAQQQQQAATVGPASASTGSDNSSMIHRIQQVTC